MNVHSIVPPLLNPFGFNPVSGLGYSPFGGPVPFGGFGAPYSIGLALPQSSFGYGATAQRSLSFSLKDQAGSLVSVGTATDHKGATVVTATLNTTKGGIIAFQSAPPSGLTLTSTRGTPSANLPSLTDSTGKAVTYGVSNDQYGGSVLQIHLSDLNGKSTTLYSQVDSLGFPISGGPSPTASTSYTDLQGTSIQASLSTDQHGNQISVVSLTNATGHSVQYQTQSPSVPSLAATLSTTNPVGPQAPQAGPTDSQGNTVGNLTRYTAAGNTVDQITLYDSAGAPTTFFAAQDSAGNATQSIQLTPVPTQAPLSAFAANPSLTVSTTTQLPKSIHPFATPSFPSNGFLI
jgi:hypothetical protein